MEISTHAPRTGSDSTLPQMGGKRNISTHAPRTGSDVKIVCMVHNLSYISTHAPRTGSDNILIGQLRYSVNFNPRSPHGERRPLKQLP